jgi:hypothetical protein
VCLVWEFVLAVELEIVTVRRLLCDSPVVVVPTPECGGETVWFGGGCWVEDW